MFTQRGAFIVIPAQIILEEQKGDV